MSSITADSHAHDAHAAKWHWSLHLELCVFARPQNHWFAVSVFDTALVPDWRTACTRDSLATGLSVVEHADPGEHAFPRTKAAKSRLSSTRCSFTMHATVMIFFVIIPILAGAFGNYLIPLMIGADDMAFPTLNMLSYWFMWPAFICIGMSFFTAGHGAAAGWTSYPPLSVVPESAPSSGPSTNVMAVGCHVCRGLLHDGLGQLHDHHHSDACSWNDDVPIAAHDLGDVHHRCTASVCACQYSRLPASCS